MPGDGQRQGRYLFFPSSGRVRPALAKRVGGKTFRTRPILSRPAQHGPPPSYAGHVTCNTAAPLSGVRDDCTTRRVNKFPLRTLPDGRPELCKAGPNGHTHRIRPEFFLYSLRVLRRIRYYAPGIFASCATVFPHEPHGYTSSVTNADRPVQTMRPDIYNYRAYYCGTVPRLWVF